jgi:hypothetical protein
MPPTSSPATRRAVRADGKDAEPAQRSRIQPVPCRYRDLVERFMAKLEHFRAVATRSVKSPKNDLASVKLAAARIWTRANESMSGSSILDSCGVSRRFEPLLLKNPFKAGYVTQKPLAAEAKEIIAELGILEVELQ